MAPSKKSAVPTKGSAAGKPAAPVKKPAPTKKDDSPAAILERRKALPPQRKSKVKQTAHKIRVIKRVGGATRFVKKIRSIRTLQDKVRRHKREADAKKIAKQTRSELREAYKNKKNKEGKAIKAPTKKPFKFEVKKMRSSYSTQLAPRTLPSSNTFKDMNFRARPRIAHLKKTLTPGTICVLLAGKYKGSRVVFLKQLKRSGLCLVSGPFKVNKVPLRRMNQNYMVATSVRLNLDKVKVPKHINDFYFQKEKVLKKKKSTTTGDEDIFESKKKVKQGPNAQRKADQKSLDRAIMGAIKKTEDKKMIIKYLKAKFAVMGRRYPHEIKF